MSVINPAFSYIQLHRQGKVPTGEMTGWPNKTRFSTSQVREWVAQGYNLGVRCDGQSGVWVLDVDVDLRNMEPSPEWFALIERHGYPDTYTVRSPSKGTHFYFRRPPGVEVRNDQGTVVAPLVDIRGKGGYVVAAGMHAEYQKSQAYDDGEVVVRNFSGVYEVVNDSPISATPDWIIDLLVDREDKRTRIQESRKTLGDVQPKAENIDPNWDHFARDELNSLFAKVEELAQLPEGGTMEIFGEQRGWERGSGFFTLACKIIEVARWPHTEITVEQARQAWEDRVPGKWRFHDWEQALEFAGPTWVWGEQQRNPIDIFDDVSLPKKNSSSLGPDDGSDEWDPLDISDRPTGWAVPVVFRAKKDDQPDEPSGAFLVERAREIINMIGPIAVDPSGSLWTYDRGVYVNDDSVVLNRLYQMIGDRFTSGILTNVRLAVQAKAPLIDLTKAPNPGIMNFTNGTLEWRESDETRHHDPSVLETTQFPYDWDPTAGCPKFDNWLSEMLEPDQIKLAWKILGYMMLSGNPLQVAFMLYGKGSNGKSTFAHVIEHLVGMENSSAVALKDFNQRFATASMIGKIANVVGDIDSDYQMSTAALKQVTGSDAMQFERKNRDSFRATLWATCLFSANRIPGTNDGSDGYAERWVPLHFKRKASEHRIDGFTEEGLWDEIQGIAAKAVRVLRTIPIHQGASRNQGFDLTSESAQEAVEEFREASNSYYAWIKNYTVPSEISVMKPKEIWQAYRLATGIRHGGTSCPQQFREVIERQYGEARMRRGMFAGHQRNIRGYAVAVVDDDDISAQDSDFFSNASI